MDIMQTITTGKLNLRIYTVETLDTSREITGVHMTTPNATSALGMAINAAALLGASLKPGSSQNLSLRIQGNGPIGEIFVQMDASGNMRGFTSSPQMDLDNALPRISFSESIGAGMISVTKDLGLKEPYSTVSPIINGELAQNIAYYLTKSEQIPSAVIIGFKLDHEGKISASGGILVQTFPDTPLSSIEEIERNISSMGKSLADTLENNGSITEYVSELIGGNKMEIISTTEIRHRCRCNREILRNVIKVLHKDEIQDMMEKEHGTEVKCTFCRKTYRFTEHDLKEILNEMN